MNLNRPVNVSTDVSNLTLRNAVAAKRLSESRRPLSEIFKTESSDHDSGISSESNSSTLSSNESAAQLRKSIVILNNFKRFFFAINDCLRNFLYYFIFSV